MLGWITKLARPRSRAHQPVVRSDAWADIPWSDGVWLIEEKPDGGFSVVDEGGVFELEDWATNGDERWAWRAGITPKEVAALAADLSAAPEIARQLLETKRRWLVTPPPEAPGGPYVKKGFLRAEDGLPAAATG
jgi:hypothetical protein